jgi:hypothetical protein
MELDYCLKMYVVFYSQVLALRGKNYGSKITFSSYFPRMHLPIQLFKESKNFLEHSVARVEFHVFSLI